MSGIIGVWARQILDSRGNPTVEVDVELESGVVGTAAVPSGASTGTREALELRDGDEKWMGKSVENAVNNVIEHIAQAILDMDSLDQVGIDKTLIELDGTQNKSKLGANAILGVSMAVARASANELGIPLYQYLGGVAARRLPVPMMNIINGGVHADSGLSIQEFMIVPAGMPTFSEAIRAGVETYHNLKSILKKKGYSVSVGDEGGFAPKLGNTNQALELIINAIESAEYKPGKHIFLAIDSAASELYKNGEYIVDGKKFTTEDLIEFYKNIVSKYPIVSIEDGFAENDWKGWELFTSELGTKLQIVGDDIFVTNPQIITEGISKKAANSVLIKLNQIGTVTETMSAIEIAHRAGWKTIISHRSGETEDTFIADLSVAVGAGQIKTGAPCRTERVAKYNRLIKIEEELADISEFPQITWLYPWIKHGIKKDKTKTGKRG